MTRIGELIGAAVLGGLAVAAVAFGVSRAQAAKQESGEIAALALAEVEAQAFAEEETFAISSDDFSANLDGLGMHGCPPNIDEAFLETLRATTQSALAGALGMTVEELEAAHEAGQNIREIAESKGIELEAVREAVEAARKAVIEQGVADGAITQEQANWLLNPPHPGGMPHIQVDSEVHERIQTAVHAAIAGALGMTVEELDAALESGTDLRELAEAAGVEPEALREAAETARIAAIDQAVADGLLTAEEAEILKNNMPPHPGGHHGPHEPGFGMPHP